MKQVIGFGRGETKHGLLIFAAVFDSSAPPNENAYILRFCDRAFTLEHWSEHNQFFVGSILELGHMAHCRIDPSFKGRRIEPEDFDYEIVLDMYRQVEKWAHVALARVGSNEVGS